MAASLAAQRKAACKTLLKQAHAIVAKEGTGADALEKIKGRLIALAARGDELFTREDFPHPEHEGRFHILDAEDNDGFGLYVSIAMPGKHAAPHDHGIWCVNAGISGRERHSIYARTDNGKKKGFATVEKVRDVLVQHGTGVCMLDHDIHANEVVGREPAVSLMLYGYAIARFPSVVWFHPEFSSVRAMPSRRATA